MADLDGPLLTPPDAATWERWLGEHHDRSGPVWLRIAKKGSDLPSPTIREALDVALCFGWIDSQRRGLDERAYVQRYSPRRPGSPWSAINVARVAELIAGGRMREPGLAQVRAAQEDGRWDAAYAGQRHAPVPEDLLAELEQRPLAAERFAAMGRTARFQLFLPLLTARTPAGRRSRLERVLAQLEAWEAGPPDG